MATASFDPTKPPDSGESARNGAARIRSIAQNVLKLFGYDGSAAQDVPVPFAVDSGGLVTVVNNPTASLGIATKQMVDSVVLTLQATGTNTYSASPSPAITAYREGAVFLAKFANNNTSDSTLNVSNLGAKSILRSAGNLPGGTLISGIWYLLVYTNGAFQLVSPNDSLALWHTGAPQTMNVPLTMASGQDLTLAHDPTSALQAATKRYVDGLFSLSSGVIGLTQASIPISTPDTEQDILIASLALPTAGSMWAVGADWGALYTSTAGNQFCGFAVEGNGDTWAIQARNGNATHDSMSGSGVAPTAVAGNATVTVKLRGITEGGTMTVYRYIPDMISQRAWFVNKPATWLSLWAVRKA